MKVYRREICFSLLLNALMALADVIGVPLHARGWAQPVMGYLLGAAHILNMPGYTASDWMGLRPMHHWTWAAFWASLGINVVFWFFAAVMAARVKVRLERRPQPAPPASDAGPRISRRTWLLSGGRAISGAGAGVAAWGFFGEARWFEVTRRDIKIKGLAPSLGGLRIVQLSDIHYGSWMSLDWVRQVIDVTHSLSPDVIALTGDYVYRGLEYVRPIARELAKLRARCGVVGVMGNHDWWEGGGVLTKQAFADERVPLIDNGRVFITPDRRMVKHAQDGLCIAGVGDLWEDKCLYADALGGVPGGMPRILLSHNPDVAEEPDFLTSGHRVDLMLSGHTHGGQVALPLIGAPVTNSSHGQKYARGLVQGPVCPVFISRGLGTTVVPVRLGARPEIAVIDLRVG